jgi:uncharacterized protein (TIGR03790 family)
MNLLTGKMVISDGGSPSNVPASKQHNLADSGWLFCLLMFLSLSVSAHSASNPGDEVFVVYNSTMPESKEVADHYAALRHIPENQILGLELPTTDNISRQDFRDKLQIPVRQTLEDRKFFQYLSEIVPATANKPGQVGYRLMQSKIRYLVFCYGVPFRILKDGRLNEAGEEEVKPELRRNEAAVDSEMAFLPISKNDYRLYGPLPNPIYGNTNAAMIHPTNGILMAARLDGPSAVIAKALVDKAMEAETNGLWGRAYFDARGFTNTPYKTGDEWMRSSAAVCKRLGFETYLDDKPELLPSWFPLSQVAIYAGWWIDQVNGPFAQPKVEFMPGAIAYHLHSYGGAAIRSTNLNWVGPLLTKGATVTMGSVDEPYLLGTPDLSVFFSRILSRYSFGEAVYASQAMLSWQTTVVGDPLYRPFGIAPGALHENLKHRASPLLEWSHLRAVNLNQVTGTPIPELIKYLQELALTEHSAVLLEKLGDLKLEQNNYKAAATDYEKALKLSPTPMQTLRLLLQCREALKKSGNEDRVQTISQEIVKKYPDYPLGAPSESRR